MNVFQLEVAAVAKASTQAVADQRDGAEHLEAAARAAGYLDADGFFFQSDEEFLADLQFDGVAQADSDLSETGAATLSLSLAA